jgi:pyrroloquinoline-quinone synthase
MTNRLDLLDALLDEKHLLKHPFYEHYWNKGLLSLETLKVYAAQYFQHVQSFPRYISATHSGCPNLAQRQQLLENLCEEEAGDGNHPALWRQFALSLGLPSEDLDAAEPLASTKHLIDTFMQAARTHFAQGMGGLYTYERQQAEIASTKKHGLQTHYGIHDPAGLQFFEVHSVADVKHAEDMRQLLASLSDEEFARAKKGALAVRDALWGFLDGVCEAAGLSMSPEACGQVSFN